MSGFKRGFLLPKNGPDNNNMTQQKEVNGNIKKHVPKTADIHSTVKKSGKPSSPRFSNLNSLELHSDGKLLAVLGSHGRKEILDYRDLRHCFIGDLQIYLTERAIQTLYKIERDRSYLRVNEFVINSKSKTESEAEIVANLLHHFHYMFDKFINADEVYIYFSTEDLKVIMKKPELVRFKSQMIQRICIAGTPETNSNDPFDIKLCPIGMDNLIGFIEDSEVTIENRDLLNLMGQYDDEDTIEEIWKLFNRLSNPSTMFRIIQIWVPKSFKEVIKDFAVQHELRQLRGAPGTTDDHYDYVIVIPHTKYTEKWFLKISLRRVEQFGLHELKFHVIQKQDEKLFCSSMCDCNTATGITKIDYCD